MRKKDITKLLACLLVVALIVCYLPITAFAADQNPSPDPNVGGSVYGTVYGAVGESITVTLTDNTVSSNVYSGTLGNGITSNGDGSFSYTFTNIPAGSYELDVTSQGFHHVVPDPVQVSNGNTTNVDVNFPALNTITGYVYDRNNQPIENVTVSNKNCISVLSGADGAYTIYLPAGDHTLNFTKDTYQDGSMHVTVSGNMVAGNMILYKVDDKVTVSGRVVDNTSGTPNPINGANVTISGNSISRSVTSDVYGLFNVDVPGNLTYDLNVSATGYLPLAQPGGVQVGSTNLDLHDITLTKATYAVTGKVYDTNQNPISGASVSVDGYTPVTTGSDGSYSIQLPVGTYTLNVTIPGYQNASTNVTVSDQNVSNVNVILIRSSSGGGSGGSSGSSNTGSSNTNISSTDLDKAINNADTAGKVTVTAPTTDNYVKLNANQLKDIAKTDKPLEVQVQGVQIDVPPVVIQKLAELGDVQITATTLTQDEENAIANEAVNKASFRLLGQIFDFNLTANGEKVSNFDDKLQIALPVAAQYHDLAAQGKLTVSYFNEATNNWEDMGGKYDAASRTIVFETNHFSKYAVTEVKNVNTSSAGTGFSDVPATYWASADINAMAYLGYVKGVAPGQFNPEASITRAEFAAMLVRIMGLKSAASINFLDVQPSDWFYDSVARAYEAGIIKGTDAGHFAPNARITREQMAAMIANAMIIKYPDIQNTKGNTNSLGSFIDSTKVSDWAKKNVAIAINSGIVKGISAGGDKVAFEPQANATRTQAVVMLKRFVDFK